MISAKQTFEGQRKPNGMFLREWEIITDCHRETATLWCFDHLGVEQVPSRAEWIRNVPKGSAKWFKGYYTMIPTKNGFRFTVARPCDVY